MPRAVSRLQRHRRLTASVLTLGGLLALAACDDSSSPPAQAQQGAAQQAMPVEVHVPELHNQEISVYYAGRTSGAREVEVRARVGGIVLERTYSEGQPVKKGDILFRIDPVPYKIALEQAEASLAQARASLRQAQRDWSRVQGLRNSPAISGKTRDDSMAALEQAQASVQAAEATVHARQIDLGYTEVKAPVSGVTSLETVSEGSLVDTTTAASQLTSITQLDPVHVVFAYPEADAARQRKLQEQGKLELASERLPVQVLIDGVTPYEHIGYVDFTESGVDPNTGTIRARAIVPNPDNRLLPGQFVRVRIHGLTLKDAITIPDKAIMQSPQGQFVYVIDDKGTAQPRPVVPGPLVESMRVIEGGLKGGEQVITSGLIKIRPGAPVAAMAADAGKPAEGAAQ
jgi:membrane fusion protein (multidrug efflux system)